MALSVIRKQTSLEEEELCKLRDPLMVFAASSDVAGAEHGAWAHGATRRPPWHAYTSMAMTWRQYDAALSPVAGRLMPNADQSRSDNTPWR